MSESDKPFVSAADMLRAQGFKIGYEEGFRISFTETLTRHFGVLPRSAIDRIGAADIVLLDRWLARFPDALSLDDVFTDS